MYRNQKLLIGFTLIELIITVVLIGLVLIPLGLLTTEHMRGIAYSRRLAVAEGLAKTEMAKVNNLAFNNPTLADGYDNITYNYEGHPYDLRRTVNYVAGSNNNLKEIRVRVYPPGDLTNHLINVLTYISNVSFGAGSAGALINIPRPGCFLAGTQILMSDSSLKAIEKVKVGDVIMGFDEKTGKLIPDEVIKFFEHNSDKYLIINNYLKLTSNHPVYSNGKWVEIGKLNIGDTLLDAQGKSEVVNSIEEVRENVPVYNLEVNPYHTYVAGGIVVHNKPPPPPEVEPVQ